MFVILQHKGGLYIVFKSTELLLPKAASQRENMHSAAAEKGCTTITFFAASAQVGKAVSYLFQISKGLYSELTSSVAAMYSGN